MKVYILLFMLNIVKAYTSINIYGTGLFLPYSLGVIGYIKKNIPITDYRITGISGGAWCSLLYTQEDDMSDHDKIWDYTIGKNITNLKIHNDLRVFQKEAEKNLKTRYKSSNKNLDKISIISTKLNGNFFSMNTEKRDKFDDVDDLIDFCLCSSYLPYLSGSTFSKKYKGNRYIDGDIKYDYNDKEIENSKIIIDRTIWGRNFAPENYIYMNKEKSRELFEYGWVDTENNKDKIISKIAY